MEKLTKKYSLENFRSDFSELENVRTHALIPLFDKISEGFIYDLDKNHQHYGITDRVSLGCTPRDDSYHGIVMDGKITKMIFHMSSPEHELVGGILKKGLTLAGREGLVDKMYSNFQEFVKRQDLSKTFSLARENLLNARDSWGLSNPIHAFYIGGVKTLEDGLKAKLAQGKD